MTNSIEVGGSQLVQLLQYIEDLGNILIDPSDIKQDLILSKYSEIGKSCDELTKSI